VASFVVSFMKSLRRTRFVSPSLASVSAKYRGKRSSSTRFARSVYSRLRFAVAASKQLSAKEKHDERGGSHFFYFAHLWNNIMLFFAFFAAVDPFARHS